MGAASQSASQQWREYKKLWVTKCAATGLLVAFMVFGGERGNFSKNLIAQGVPGVLLLTLAVLAATFLIWAEVQLSIWRCPRCRRPFLGFWGRHIGRYTIIRTHCRYCGLEKWADPDASSQVQAAARG